MVDEQRLELLNVREVAARLRVSPPTVYRRIQQGDLVAHRLGPGPCSPIRIDADELDRFLDRTRPRRASSRAGTPGPVEPGSAPAVTRTAGAQVQITTRTEGDPHAA